MNRAILQRNRAMITSRQSEKISSFFWRISWQFLPYLMKMALFLGVIIPKMALILGFNAISEKETDVYPLELKRHTDNILFL